MTESGLRELGPALASYLDRFLKGPEGGFYTTQDADLNAHDRTKPFLNGHDYYVLSERERLAKGLPRVDTNEYGRENGLAAIAHYTQLKSVYVEMGDVVCPYV